MAGGLPADGVHIELTRPHKAWCMIGADAVSPPSNRAELMRHIVQPLVVGAVSRVVVMTLAFSTHGLVVNKDTTGQLRDARCSWEAPISSNQQKIEGNHHNWIRSQSLKLLVWDAVHFAKISRCGYETEQSQAFFPFLPGLLSILTSGSDDEIALMGMMLSNTAFVISTILMQSVSRMVLQDDHLAQAATMLYSMSPSSIFFSAAYTESMYMLLALAAFWHLQQAKPWQAAALLSLCTAMRSNGITNIWFVAYQEVAAMRSRHWHVQTSKVLQACCRLAGCSCIVAAPLLAFQCHVQRKYWNVGLLRSYRLKQAPNVLLAAPMLWLSWQGCRRALASAWAQTKDSCFAGGRTVGGPYEAGAKTGYDCAKALPYVYHWAMMAAIAALFMNIQVTTRFCSTCPAMYWYCAHASYYHQKHWVLWYFGTYVVLGCVLFPNWFPWV